MAQYILALDQGTTSSRAILFDQNGGIARSSQKEFRQHYPRPGWVEHDAGEIWATQLEVARDVGADAPDIAAIGISNQRETTVIWDRETGEPIHNAIVWQDRRTAALCDELKSEGFDATILQSYRARHRCVLSRAQKSPGCWITWTARANKRKRVNWRFGTIDSYLVWKLSGGRLHITDVSNAARTMLFDIHRGEWADAILERLNIPRAILPDVRPCSQLYGESDVDILGSSIPIAGMAGDQQAATFGQAAYQASMAKNTYGTGCFLLMNTGETPQSSANNLLTTIAWQIAEQPKQYALEGSVFMAGAAVQWLRDELKLLTDAAESEAIASAVDSSEGVYVVPAFVGLGAPYWDQYARGTIVGLTRGSGRAQIVRATLESIAYQTRDVVDAMKADSGLALEALRVDGGAVVNDFLHAVSSRYSRAFRFSVQLSPKQPPLAPPTWRAWQSASGNRKLKLPGNGSWSAPSSRRCRPISASPCITAGSERLNARVLGLRTKRPIRRHGRVSAILDSSQAGGNTRC